MYIKQPRNYESLVTPYSQRLLQFGVDDSKIYLSEAANAVFRSFTNGYTPDETSIPYDQRKNAILDGGYVETALDGTSLIQITLKPTTMIADNVLLVFPEEAMVDVDVESLDDEGEILLFLNYRYIQTIYENPPVIKALYYDGTDFTPDEFDTNRDLVLLNKIKFEKTDGVVTKITTFIDDPYSQVQKNFINILGNDYEIAPLANLWYQIIKGYQDIHCRRQTFALTLEDWTEEVPVFDIGGVGIFYQATLNIDVVRRKLCNVQCYISNLKINPTAIQHIDDTTVKIWMPEDWVTQENLPEMSVIVTG